MTSQQSLFDFNTPTCTGLDAAGKTTIFYKLKLGEIVTVVPTIGIHKQCSCTIINIHE